MFSNKSIICPLKRIVQMSQKYDPNKREEIYDTLATMNEVRISPISGICKGNQICQVHCNMYFCCPYRHNLQDPSELAGTFGSLLPSPTTQEIPSSPT